MARLVGVGALQKGRRWTIEGSECIVGRALDCDIAIEDQRVSRHHARVLRAGDGLRLEDLGSVNGTFLNRRRVHGQAVLAEGDEIIIGSARFVVDLSDERVSRASAGRITISERGPLVPEVIEVANLRPDDALRTSTQPVRVDLAREVERLHHKLRTMYQVSETVASALKPGDLLGRVVEQLLAVFPQAVVAAAVARDRRSDELHTVAVRNRDGSPAEMLIADNVIDRVVRQGRSVLLRTATPNTESSVPRITVPDAAEREPKGFRMGAPLIFQGVPHGILYLEADEKRGTFDQADLDLLGGIAAQAGVAMHLAGLHERLLVQDRLDKDLTIARQIQRSLLPREPPHVTGLEFAVHYEPAFHVGGDFFDFVWLDPTRLAIVIGDVAGKAISGALFMARVASEIRAQAPLQRDPHRILRRVNRAIADATDDGMFCTALVLCIDLERHVARFANAGHTVPLLRRNGDVSRVDVGSARTVPLGIEPDLEVGEAEVALLPGDTLLFYTDGLIEARAEGDAYYGESRLVEAFARSPAGAQSTVDALLADIDRFVGDEGPSDDQTIIALNVVAARSRPCDSVFPTAHAGETGRG